MRRPASVKLFFHFFLFFLPSSFFSVQIVPMESSRLCRHPSIRTLFLSDCRSVQVGCTRFSRCCYLIIDLCSPFAKETGPGLSRSHLISAVEFGSWIESPFSLFCSFFFFPAFPSFPQRNFAPGSPSNDDGQLPRPLASPVLWRALHSRPPHASLCGYCAVVRRPLHSPTTGAAVPLAFSPPQPRRAS